MVIRRAKNEDMQAIISLLEQVNLIHHTGRPDLFKRATKYTAEQLALIIADDNRPVLVADDEGEVKGYAFCVLQQRQGDVMLTDVKTLYIDDLCVDENCRGKHIGKQLYSAVIDLAKAERCHNVTLNAWCLNPDAIEFYKKCGMTPLKICMEQIIE